MMFPLRNLSAAVVVAVLADGDHRLERDTGLGAAVLGLHETRVLHYDQAVTVSQSVTAR